MKKFWIVFLLAVLVGCQTAFERDTAYVKREKPKVSAAPRESVHKTRVGDLYRPIVGREDIGADFSCDVERPSDPQLAAYVDACLAEAYHHSRGEERKGIETTGATGVRDAFFADYKEWYDENGADVAKGEVPAYVGKWNCQVEGRIVLCDQKHFSCRITIDTYCGGAHPNRWVQNATYSRKDGRRLAVADVVMKESMTDVVNLIRKAVRAQAQEDQQLYEQLREEIRQPYDEYVRDIRDRKRDEWGNPLVTENFMLTKDGIVWTFNQYEIACYASGWFDALVPWKALTPHLREKSAISARS